MQIDGTRGARPSRLLIGDWYTQRMTSRLRVGFRKPASAKSQSPVASVRRDLSQGPMLEPEQIAASLDVGRVGHATHQRNGTNPPLLHSLRPPNSTHSNSARTPSGWSGNKTARDSSNTGVAGHSSVPTRFMPAAGTELCEREGHLTEPTRPWDSTRPMNRGVCERCGASWWWGDENAERPPEDQVPHDPPPPPAPRPSRASSRKV